MSDAFDEERERVSEIALRNPRPCTVCGSGQLVGVGTWVPNARYLLAAGGNPESIPVFAFWVCEAHSAVTEENEKLIRQAVLRAERTGDNRRV